MSKHADDRRLRVQSTLDVPLREVSGICLRRCDRDQMFLVAVGDRAATLALAPVTRSGAPTLDWRTIDIANLPGSPLPAKDAQIEAICADGAGRVLLLQETPARAVLVDLDAPPARVVASIDLVIEGDSDLAESWNDPDCSRGEGAALLADGHLLVAKEKRPTALIEFGPPGSASVGFSARTALAGGAPWPVNPGSQRYVALAVWRPDKMLRVCCDDFSDLEIGPDGELYLLSDKSAAIARLEPLVPGGGAASLSAEWFLEDLDGAKPEGLSFAPDGRAIVALDKRKRHNNLVLLEPAIAITMRAAHE